MIDDGNRYCDRCWAIILARGYIISTDHCDDCVEQILGVDERGHELPVDVVEIERPIV